MTSDSEFPKLMITCLLLFTIYCRMDVIRGFVIKITVMEQVWLKSLLLPLDLE